MKSNSVCLNDVFKACAEKRKALDALLTETNGENLANPTANPELIEKIENANKELSDAFNQIVHCIRAAVSSVAKKLALDEHQADELLSISLIHLMRKIALYKDGNPAAWTRTVCSRLALSKLFRKTKHPAPNTNFDGIEEVTLPTTRSWQYVQPRTAQSATPEEKAKYFAINNPQPEYKYLFLFGSGQWDEFRERAPTKISNGRSPSAWELNYLNNLGRCHQVAFDWTDADVAAKASVRDEDQQEGLGLVVLEQAYDRALVSQRQKIAQTISRYYWQFLLIPSVWQRLLGPAQPESDETLPEELGSDQFARLMLFDGWMAIPVAQTFQGWTDGLGLKCSRHANFLSICRFPIPDQSGKGVNRRRWEQLCRWFEESQLESPNLMENLRPDANDDTVFRLNETVLSGKCSCDLPLPFDSRQAIQQREQIVKEVP